LQADSAARARGASELLELYLSRVESENPALNAIVTLDAEQARVRAAQVDSAASRREWWGSLHGVPVTIQDTLD
jgi:amidase